MFLFEPRQFAAKGKNREPGLQAFSVRKMTGRRIPVSPFFLPILFSDFVLTPSDTPGLWL
jgi:hypothetical protein